MSGKSRLGTAIGGALLTLALALPQAASGGVLGDVLGDVQDTVDQTVGGVLGGAGGSGGTGGASPAPAPAPTPAAGGPETTPPLDGDNPHARGAVIDTDVDNPLLPDLGVTIGESRGDQDDQGNYSGVVRVISVTGLGNPIELQISTEEGDPPATGPFGPINDGLDDLCTQSSICLNVLDYDSETTEDGSSNSFSAASASIGGEGLLLPVEAVSAGVLTSEGNISETNKCQTASANSSAADVGVLNDAVNADVLSSESESEACRGQASESTNDSTVAQLNGTGLLALLGCDEGTVDDEFPDPPLNALVDGVCNGDDTNGAQADAPYNVRKALGIDVLPAVLTLVGVGVDLDASKSETLAQAPDPPDRPEPECPDPDNPDCDEDEPECPDAGNPKCDDDPNDPGGPGDPDGPSAPTPEDSLPFTGSDLTTLGLIGVIVMAAGLGLMALADRRRRTVA